MSEPFAIVGRWGVLIGTTGVMLTWDGQSVGAILDDYEAYHLGIGLRDAAGGEGGGTATPQAAPPDPLLEEVKSLRSWRKEAEGLLREARDGLRHIDFVLSEENYGGQYVPNYIKQRLRPLDAFLGEREGTEGQ